MATFECSDKVSEALIVSGEFVIASCYTPEVFELAEKAFKHIALFVEFPVERPPLCGCGSTGHDLMAPVVAAIAFIAR